MSTLDYIEIKPQLAATHTVIWLHGLGASGDDFAGIVPELGLSSEIAVRFILPHAPVRGVSINKGMRMRAWYDIYGLTTPVREDAAGIKESYALIKELIEAEHQRGIAYENIVLAGFSQGGALALFSGLCFDHRLAGILVLSGYVPIADTLFKERSPANKAIPIFMAHGLYDPVVPIALAQHSCSFLESSGYPVEWHSYPMEHTVSLEELKDIRFWLQARL
jgi:phospholipase/carboxylesterase